MDEKISLCDTELSLRVGSVNTSDKPTSLDGHGRFSSSRGTTMEQQLQQKMTIVYGDRACVCDISEIQARAIISLAQRVQMGQCMKLNNTDDSNSNIVISSRSKQLVSPSLTPSPPPTPVPQFQCPELSMKRSLQRFLEKRNTRIDSASPYLLIRRRVPISRR